MYHIFKVYDYKGGELSSRINLTKEQLIEEFCEDFDFEIKSENTVEDIEEMIKERLNDDFYSTYGSYDHWCGEMYKTVDGKLISIGHLEFVREIAEKLKSYQENNG